MSAAFAFRMASSAFDKAEGCIISPAPLPQGTLCETGLEALALQSQHPCPASRTSAVWLLR